MGGLFGWQQIQLHIYNGRWDAIKTRVTELQKDTANIEKYRPWFDQSFGALTILAKLTSAFPETGSVTVKSIEIRDLSTVSAHGTATTMVAFNVMRESLGRIPGVVELHSETAGNPQIQYNLAYQWQPKAAEGTSNGN